MSTPRQSVFISYTREDLAATRRIADALSAFEVEVWFDQDGLEGGDAWDQKIRRQIKECSLFIPIISARTQARREAYFRLEWKLAEERTHLMAEGTSFLLPIAIDDTREESALVPESFRRTQWTRLSRGVPNTSFVDRVRALLESQRSPGGSAAVPDPAPVARARKKWLPAALVIALAVGASIPFWSRKNVALPTTEAALPDKSALADKSIAVLPFTNMSDDKENAYFADGVHEDILTNLANIAALKVISRTSMMQYRGTTKTIRQIGTELGVAYVLEGSVRRVGNKVRVTGQLINTRTDEHLWAKNYDRDLTDIFAIQSEVAKTIATSLNAVLAPREIARLEARPTSNMEAYDAFLKCRREFELAVNPGSLLEKALPLAENAVRLDPQFGAAWAMVCMIHLSSIQAGNQSDTHLAVAQAALAKAESLTPDDLYVLRVGASMGLATRDRARINQRLHRIIELMPGQAEAHAQLGLIAIFDGRWNEILPAYRKAYDLDPRNTELASAYGSLLIEYHHYEEAGAVVRALAAQDPENLEHQLRLAELPYLSQGSKMELETFLARLPEPGADDLHFHTLRATTLRRLGDPLRQVQFWEKAGERWRAGEGARSFGGVVVAAAYHTLKNEPAARALRLADRAHLEKSLAEDKGRFRPFLLNRLGNTLANLGEVEAARKALAEVRQILANETDRSRGAMMGISWRNTVMRVLVGEKAEAMAELKLHLRTPFGPNVHQLRNEWEGLPLRGDPDFEALLNDPANNAPLY